MPSAGRAAEPRQRAPEQRDPEQRLADLGLAVPPVAAPLAAYVPAVRSGALVYTSGQLPLVEGKLLAAGKLGAEVDPARGPELARVCALNALAAVKAEVGDLRRVRRAVRVVCDVASAPGFTGQPAVVNGASELLGQVFGEAGHHARSAVGVAVQILDAPVDLELVV